ncbi:MAG: hypothetical protein EU551_00895 [Promethearchaeota archaeon]|nr:MAG: hypothetical protein EU551_00895 [Candidatus Lokiarchaeota archaeon]
MIDYKSNEIIEGISKSNLFQKFCIIYDSSEIIHSNFNPEIEKYIVEFVKIQKTIEIGQYFILDIPNLPIQFILYHITDLAYFLGNASHIKSEHIELLDKISEVIYKEALKGIVFSTANVHGPTPQTCFPNLDENFKNVVAMKSLILLAGNQDERKISSSIIPILDDYGLIYLFYIHHPEGRGGIFDSAITIVVDGEIRNLIIKHLKKITNYIEAYVKNAAPKLNKEGDLIKSNQNIKELYQSIEDHLMNIYPIEVFPVGDTKKDIDSLKNSINDLRKMLGNIK